MKDAPYGLLFDEPHPDWIGAGLVTAERAILHPEPAEAAGRKRPYLVAFDPVAVLARRPGWVRVAYLDGAAGPGDRLGAGGRRRPQRAGRSVTPTAASPAPDDEDRR